MSQPATLNHEVASRREASLVGCLLGTAAGDSIGLPFENLSKRSVAKLQRDPELAQSLLLGRGLLSDDTEHAALVGLSLLESGNKVDVFRRRLAARLRWWFAALPPGVGSATARSSIKLWFGASPERSGVRSAGNGPAMRAALLGAFFADDLATAAAFVEASTLLTHRDSRAIEGALLVAVAAACASRAAGQCGVSALSEVQRRYAEVSKQPDVMKPAFEAMRSALERGETVGRFADAWGCGRGVYGYVMHTVPVAVYAAIKHANDLRTAVSEMVRCGGDTDTTAAIVGGIVGAGLGPDAAPTMWLDGLVEWPHDVRWLRSLGSRLAQEPPRQLGISQRVAEAAMLPWYLVRNLTMLAVLLAVLCRRTTLVLLRRPD